jgi:hypothetical protein
MFLPEKASYSSFPEFPERKAQAAMSGILSFPAGAKRA